MNRKIEMVEKNGINHLYVQGKNIKFKPWLGDLFSVFYDYIMEKSIFPKKFDASIDEHMNFLKKEYSEISSADILELATGSGNVSEVLSSNNRYSGIDISQGLLKRAYRNLPVLDLKVQGLLYAVRMNSPSNPSLLMSAYAIFP